jgi:hypothetical protein
VVAFFLFAAIVSQAQQFVGVSAFYEALPDRRIEAGGVFPILLNKDPDTGEPGTIFINRFAYENTVYNFDDWGFRAGSSGETEMFHCILYNLFFIQRLNDRWGLVAMVEPSLSSDFGAEVSIDDFYLTVQAGFTVKVLENLVLGATAGYTIGFAFPYPILFIQWDITDRLQLLGFLPMFASLQLSVSQYLDLGINAELEFRSHHGDPDKYGVDNPQFSYINMRAGPFVQLNLGEVKMGEETYGIVHLLIEGGYYFYRNWGFLDGAEPRIGMTLDGAFFVRGGLILGI